MVLHAPEEPSVSFYIDLNATSLNYLDYLFNLPFCTEIHLTSTPCIFFWQLGFALNIGTLNTTGEHQGFVSDLNSCLIL